MRKMWKQTASALLSAALIFGNTAPMSAFAAVDVDALEDGTAYLSINNVDWSDYEAEYTNALITGDGQYTVSMEAAEPQDLVQFNALQVKNGESVLGNGCILTVDEIKINGEVIELQGDSYTCSVDGAGVDTRVNLYNEWNTPVDADGKVGDDFRSLSDPADTTAMLWSTDLQTGVQSVEVTFTVSDYGVFVETAADDEEYVLAEDAGEAYLNINKPDWSEYKSEDTKVTVDGDGTYTVSKTMAEAIDLGDFNALEITDGEHLLGNGSIVTVDEIKINGEAVELAADSYTCSADGAGIITRVNLWNIYNNPTNDDGTPSASDVRSASDLADTSACIIPEDKLAGVESIEVTFTVSDFGTFVAAEGEEAAAAAEIDLNGVYHAYIGFQSPTYSFRNAWDGDDGYGHDTPEFNQVTGWEGSTELVIPGTFDDVEIAGNGTYTVAAHGLDFQTDDWSQDHMNLIFFSTDIPNTTEITFSDVQLKVNGNNVSISNTFIDDETTCLRVMLQNIWDTDNGIAELPFYQTPVTDLEITFTVSGFAYDKAADDTAAAAEAPAADVAAPAAGNDTAAPATEGGSNTGAIVALIAAVAAAGGAAVVLSKKKNNKEGE